MKAVLLSIRAYWCELISRGQKTVEVRKTKPKAVQTPFKCYIYRTKTPRLAGAIIGEFTCDKIWELAPICHAPDDVEEQACMDRDYIVDYLRCKGFGWHISDLKIYDKPRDLDEFSRFGFWGMNGTGVCGNYGCKNYEPSDSYMIPPTCKINGCSVCRPPQSWCYVEDFCE